MSRVAAALPQAGNGADRPGNEIWANGAGPSTTSLLISGLCLRLAVEISFTQIRKFVTYGIRHRSWHAAQRRMSSQGIPIFRMYEVDRGILRIKG